MRQSEFSRNPYHGHSLGDWINLIHREPAPGRQKRDAIPLIRGKGSKPRPLPPGSFVEVLSETVPVGSVIPNRPPVRHPGRNGSRRGGRRTPPGGSRPGRGKKQPRVLGGTRGSIGPGDVLLSHTLEVHYHRGCGVSLPCSEWERVGPPRYGSPGGWRSRRAPPGGTAAPFTFARNPGDAFTEPKPGEGRPAGTFPGTCK